MWQKVVKCYIMPLPLLSYIYWLIQFNGTFGKGKVQMILLIASIEPIWTKFKKLTFLRTSMLVGAMSVMKFILVNCVYFINRSCLLVTDSYLKNTEMFWSPKTRSSRPEVFCKKGVPKKFAKFTEKYLCHILFINNASGPSP